MSLFGDESPPAAAAASSTRKSANLFGDDTTTTSSSSATPSRNTTNNTSASMFGDATTNNAASADDSPWGFTPTKKAGGGNLVRTLLAAADVPDVYIDAFDSLQQTGGYVSAAAARGLLKEAAPENEGRIWGIVSSSTGQGGGGGLGRGEFNVLLALIGLAQEGEEVSLDSVDERRRNLPVPRLPTRPAPQSSGGAPQQTQRRDESFGVGGLESDPWASPEMHKGHKHLQANGRQQERTTSSFTTASSAAQDGNGASQSGYGNGHADQSGTGGGSWGGTSGFGASGGAAGNEGFASAPPGGDGEGFGGDSGAGTGTVRRAAPTRPTISRGQEEVVTVNLLEEKEGMFMFQHRNYEVASVRRASKVIRRYSDFVWLLDCLHKRYPFRQLPLLPPKRVAINGNHLAADQTFLEKRRRGLARFANALVRHPVLREEQLVIMFLTVPTELSVWRKQATLTLVEEFHQKPLPPNLEDSLPATLPALFDTVRSGVRRSADLYINLCNLTERLCKRKEALAAEYSRFATNLTSITECSADVYAIDTNDVPLLNSGINGTAKHVSDSRALEEDEARGWEEGLLEDLKVVRDGLVSMREMFERKQRGERDNIPALERRIMSNEGKLQGIKAKGDAAKPGEAEKVESAIMNDKQSIVEQHARGVFIKECVRDEILFFNQSQYMVSRLHQDWAAERVKYAELGVENWRRLAEEVEGMPTGE